MLQTDIVIVGSGMSGLTTAYRLVTHGLRVVVIEATDQIGGRTRSLTTESGDMISYGGTWSTFENASTLGLADEIDCFPFLPEIRPQLSELHDLVTHPYLVIKLWLVGRKIAALGEDYGSSDLAKKYDKLSLKEWLDKQDGFLDTERNKQAVLDYIYVMESFSIDPNTISCLFMAIMVYRRMSNMTSTGFPISKNLRWEGGTGIFVSRLVDVIKKTDKATFLTEQPVISIEQNADTVIVSTSDHIIHAKTVVVATSLPAALQITYNPPLPEPYTKLFSSIIPWNDPALNIILIMKTHFISGILPLPAFQFPTSKIIGPIFDLTPKNSTKGYYRILCNPDFTKDMNEDQLRDSALDLFSSFYPTSDVRDHYESMIIINWLDQQPWIPAVAYYYPPLALTSYGHVLRTSFGLIRWAGAERAFNGLHWIEGAIHRGNEVAADILLTENKIQSTEDFYSEITNHSTKGIARIKSQQNSTNSQNFLFMVKSTLHTMLSSHDHFRSLITKEEELLRKIDSL